MMGYEEFTSRLDGPANDEGLTAFYKELVDTGLPADQWGAYAMAVLDKYPADGSDDPRWHAAYNVASNM